MKRREFISLVGGAAAAWPFEARAQQAGMPVVGFLHFASPDTYAHLVSAFLQALRESAFVEGQNVRIEYRWANGEYDRLPALAVDLVNRQVAAIVAGGVLAAQAATAATTTIPIVFNSGVDPVTVGIVASLSRPGGNVTGVSSITLELGVKRLELLLEAMPQARVVALLINPDNPGGEREVTEVTEAAARALGLEIRKLRARNERDLDAAFAGLKTSLVDALIVGNDGYFTHRREQITNLAARQGVPTIYPRREFVAAGGLISYSNSLADAYRLVGIYVAKILKGAKPADLPVVQPTKFELVINLTTAKVLGLTIPQSILLTRRRGNRMKRREFIARLAAMVAWASAARAQRHKVRRVGWLDASGGLQTSSAGRRRSSSRLFVTLTDRGRSHFNRSAAIVSSI